jgi:hypothetical protein
MSLLFNQRQTTRQYINEHDKASVISIFPMDITEKKVTLQPATFFVPMGTPDKPSITLIGGASWWRDIQPDEPLLEIPQPASLVAQSVVEDYVIGILGYSKEERQPGLFWLPGVVTEAELKTKYKNELAKSDRLQKAWYMELIKMADAIWARTNGNPIAIADLMRIAAKQTQTERAWTRDFSMVEMTKCPACGAPRNPEFPICGACKTVVDPKKYKELGLAV